MCEIPPKKKLLAISKKMPDIPKICLTTIQLTKVMYKRNVQN